MDSAIIWVGFIAIVLVLLGLDLFVLNRKAHVIEVREALLMTLMWVGISLCFNVAVYFLYEHHVFNLGVYKPEKPVGLNLHDAALLPSTGKEAAIMFFTGYLVEQMLSLDNMLVIAMIMGYFRVPAKLQHRVLFWGIIGAVVLRGLVIVAGSALIERWHWIIYCFGGLLLLSAFKMLVTREDEADMERNLVVRLARRFFRVSPGFDGDKFFTRIDSKLALTPLMLALLVVDVVDVIFAVDSIPAIFGVPRDPFLVFSSNCFAILGLRAIYFAIAAMIRRFRYLKISMVFVLGYIGIKMIADAWYKISPITSLVTILGMLTIGLMASLIAGPAEAEPHARPIDDLTNAAENTWKRARKIIILILGLTIVFIVAPLVGALPGPGGIFVAIGGLGLLATEFVWARKLLTTMKQKAQNLAGATISARPKLWMVPLVLGIFAILVTALIWAEIHFQDHLPKWAKNVYFLTIGPGIAVAYWAFMTTKRWFKFRRDSRAGNTSAPDAAPVQVQTQDDSQQRQQAGSAQ